MSAVKAIYAGIRALGIGEEDDRRDLYERVTGKRRLREMTPSDKESVVAELRRLGFRRQIKRRPLTGPFAAKLQALWISAWNLGLVRNRSDKALLAFVKRQSGIDDTRFLQDADDARVVIEALKSWIAREGGVDWSNFDRLEWLKKHGAKVALAQWLKLEPNLGDASFAKFQAAVFAITGPRANLVAVGDADWRAVMNDFGARIRKSRKGRRHVAA